MQRTEKTIKRRTFGSYNQKSIEKSSNDGLVWFVDKVNTSAYWKKMGIIEKVTTQTIELNV